MSVTVRLSLEHRLFGLEPLIMNMEPAKARDQANRFTILEKIEVPREERPIYFNMSASINQQIMPDWAAMRQTEPLLCIFEKAELREIKNLLDETPMPVDQMRWAGPLRAQISEILAMKEAAEKTQVSLTIEGRLGLETLISRMDPKKPAELATAFDIFQKVRMNRRQKEKYFKELTPSAINWGAVEAADEIDVEFTKQEVHVLLDDVLKQHKVAVKDMEWILLVREQIESQLRSTN